MRKLVAFLALFLAATFVAGAAPMRAVLVPEIGITTVLLHQVSDAPVETVGGADQVQRPWVTPAEFDRMLTEADQQGFHYVTLDQALAFLQGRAPASSLP